MSWLKIYTDASWDPNTKMASCGFIIIKNKTPITKQVVFMDNVRTSYIAEGYAILFALEELNMHFRKGDIVFLYSDQIRLVGDIQHNRGDGLFKDKIRNIISVMKMNGVELKIKFVKSHQKELMKNPHNVCHDEIDRVCGVELKKFQKENLVG